MTRILMNGLPATRFSRDLGLSFAGGKGTPLIEVLLMIRTSEVQCNLSSIFGQFRINDYLER